MSSPFRSSEARARYLERYALRAKSWPVRSEEREVPTSFGTTFVRVSGSGPALLMLPGVSSPGLSLGVLAGELSKMRTTYVIDNIHDVGRSVETKSVTSADDFTQWLDEVRRGLGLDRVDLLGLSYGGWISAQYALRFPQALRSVVLLAPAGTVAPIPFGFVWRALMCLLPGERWMRNFMAWCAPELREQNSPILEEMADDGRLALKSFSPRKMVAPVPLTDARWAQLGVRTIFLAGDREVFFDANTAKEKLARVAPRVEAEIVAGAGHDFFTVRAKALAQRLAPWLDAEGG